MFEGIQRSVPAVGTSSSKSATSTGRTLSSDWLKTAPTPSNPAPSPAPATPKPAAPTGILQRLANARTSANNFLASHVEQPVQDFTNTAIKTIINNLPLKLTGIAQAPSQEQQSQFQSLTPAQKTLQESGVRASAASEGKDNLSSKAGSIVGTIASNITPAAALSTGSTAILNARTPQSKLSAAALTALNTLLAGKAQDVLGSEPAAGDLIKNAIKPTNVIKSAGVGGVYNALSSGASGETDPNKIVSAFKQGTVAGPLFEVGAAGVGEGIGAVTRGASNAIEANKPIPPEMKPLADAASKYKNANEFVSAAKSGQIEGTQAFLGSDQQLKNIYNQSVKIAEPTTTTESKPVNKPTASSQETPTSTVKSAPETTKTPETTQTPSRPIDFLSSQKNLEVKQVPSAGVDLNGNKIASRLEWDSNSKKGTLYVSPEATDQNIAHEVGHYLDKSISTDTREALMPEAKAIAPDKLTPNETIAEAIGKQIVNPEPDKYPGINALLARNKITPDTIQVDTSSPTTSPTTEAVPATNNSRSITNGGQTPEDVKPLNTPSYNPHSINSEKDIQNLIAQTSKMDESKIQTQRRGSISSDQLKELAMMTGTKTEDIVKAKPGSIANAETVLAARQHVVDAAKDLSEYAKGIADTKTPEQMQEFAYRLNRFRALQQSVAGFRTEAGRLLSQFNMQVIPGENDLLSQMVNDVSKIDPKSANELKTVQNVSKATQPKTLDNFISAFKAGLLSDPKIAIFKLASDIVHNGLNQVSNIPASVADTIQSLFTGERTKSVGFGGAVKGMIAGSKEAPAALFGKGANDVWGSREIKFSNPILDKTVGSATRLVFNALDAATRPTYRSAFEASIQDQANALSKNADVSQSAGELRSNPTDEMIKQATHDADVAVFKGSSFMGNSLTKLRQQADKNLVSKIAFNFFMPFGKVASAAAKATTDYTPLGLGTELINQLGGKGYNQRALSEAIGKTVTGSLGLLSLGYGLGKMGKMTGNYPANPDEAKLWQAQGKQENSILIGNRWYSLNKLQPFGAILGAGAQVQHDLATGATSKSAVGAVESFLKSLGETEANQPFLLGASQGLNALTSPDKSAKQFITSSVTGLEPGILRASIQGTDQYQRKVSTPADALKSITPPHLGLPSERDLPIKKDAFQNPLTQPRNIFGALLDPFSSTPNNNNKVITEMNRLTNTGNHPSLTDVSTDGRFQSLATQKSSAVQTQALQAFSRTYQQELAKRISSPAYQSMSDAEKTKVLTDVKTAVVNSVFKDPRFKLNKVQASNSTPTKLLGATGGKTIGLR